MKAGDLVRYYKNTVVSEDGDTYFYKKTHIAVVIEDYEPSMKLIRIYTCLLYTSPSPRDRQKSRMPSSA